VAVPNHTSIAAAIYARLTTELVSGYAIGVHRAAAAPAQMPTSSQMPAVIFTTSAEYEDTDATSDAQVSVTVYIVRKADGSAAYSDSAVGQVVAALHRWTPTVSGMGTSPIGRLSSGDGPFDTDHVADVIEFGTLLSEGS